MRARMLSLALVVFVTCVTATNCQDVVRLATGAQLTAADPPGTVIETSTTFSNPSGSVQGTVSASVSRAPANEQVTRTLRQFVLEANINNASLIISSNQDLDALAEGLQFDAELRGELLAKSSDRLMDSDVVAIKAIAKSALDTEEVFKLAKLMVVSTIGTHDEILESEFVKLLSDRALMIAILNANPTTQFVPDEDLDDQIDDDDDEDEGLYSSVSVVVRAGEGRSSSTFARSDASTFVQGQGYAETDGSAAAGASVDQTVVDPLFASMFVGMGRRRLLCDACSPVNSFVCAHCWPKNICVNYAWCSRSPRRGRRRRRNRSGG